MSVRKNRGRSLFIGFSFSDYYVKEFFFNLAKQIGKEDLINAKFVSESGQVHRERIIKHYLIIDEDNEYFKKYQDKIFDELNQFNIYPVIYKKEQHIFLEYLFDKLSQSDIRGDF